MGEAPSSAHEDLSLSTRAEGLAHQLLPSSNKTKQTRPSSCLLPNTQVSEEWSLPLFLLTSHSPLRYLVPLQCIKSNSNLGDDSENATYLCPCLGGVRDEGRNALRSSDFQVFAGRQTSARYLQRDVLEKDKHTVLSTFDANHTLGR